MEVFVHTFQEAETSAKGVGSSPIPEAEKTPAGLIGAGDAAASPAYNQNFFFTEPADPSTHVASGMNMFGSAKNQGMTFCISIDEL